VKKRPKPSFRDAVDAVVIGWLPNGPDPVEPDCPPIALRYSKPVLRRSERAALAWTEAVTLISHGSVSDTLYEEGRQHFSEREPVDLTLALVAINGWNRLSISFRTVPGTYQPKAPAAAGATSRKGAII
jgi:alkylhydroperoxidase family enzyme